MLLMIINFLFLVNQGSLTLSLSSPRKIVVVRDVRPQVMYCYEGDSLVAKFLVSTGRNGYETALGEYQILTKRPRVWSRKWKCWMLWWQSFTEPKPLRNGIHALENKDCKKYLGYPNSHGCVRLSLNDAKWFFDWTEIGDSVHIVQNLDR